MIAKSYSAIGKFCIKNKFDFPITSLYIHTDKVENTENFCFLSQFKTRSFEGFANIENRRFSISLKTGNF